LTAAFAAVLSAELKPESATTSIHFRDNDNLIRGLKSLNIGNGTILINGSLSSPKLEDPGRVSGPTRCDPLLTKTLKLQIPYFFDCPPNVSSEENGYAVTKSDVVKN
jgi:hypothetical protein